jgi:hypothetical protein
MQIVIKEERKRLITQAEKDTFTSGRCFLSKRKYTSVISKLVPIFVTVLMVYN